MATNPIDLVIFDCDGVLVDSEVIISAAHIAVLTEAGYTITAQELLDRFTGVPEPVVLKTLQAETGIPVPSDYSARVSARVERETALKLQPIPGVREVLAAMTLPRCVASSGPIERVRRSLQLTGLLEYFDPHLFSGSMVARGKPAPDLFLYAAEKLGAAPARCVVVEDSPSGVEAGVASGMRVIGFCGGGHVITGHAETLRARGAAAVTADMSALPGLLAKGPLS